MRIIVNQSLQITDYDDAMQTKRIITSFFLVSFFFFFLNSDIDIIILKYQRLK